VRKTIQCPMCGTPFPLPSERENPRPKVLRVGDLVLNPATHDVTRAGKEIALSPTEVRLLESLMRQSGRIVPRNALVHSVWDSNDEVDDNLIDVTIYQLRKKVDRDLEVKLIKTVRKLGYTIRDPAKVR
jgi:two-component system, OmpR family, response regulator